MFLAPMRVPLRRKLTSQREGVGSSGLNHSEAALQHNVRRTIKCPQKYDKLNVHSSIFEQHGSQEIRIFQIFPRKKKRYFRNSPATNMYLNRSLCNEIVSK